MIKKVLCLLVAAIMMVGLLAACGSTPDGDDTLDRGDTPGGGSSGEASSNGGAEPTTLTFWTFQQSHAAFLEDAARSWNQLYPDRQINFQANVYGYDDNHNNLLISLQTGTGAPDIVDLEIGRFANYLQGEPQLVPMNDVLAPIQDRLIMSRFENYAKDGKYYGMDYHVGIPVIYYNTEIMARAGVDIDSIKTWDDYIEAGKQVVERTGIPMTTLETTEHWSYYPLITQRNSDWFDANGNVTMDNAANAEVLQVLYDMMYVHEIAVAAPGGFHHTEEYYGFMNDGGAASVWMPQWYMNRFTDYMSDLHGKVAIRPLPRWTEDGPYGAGMGGTGTSVTNQSQHQQLALDFLVYAKLSEEGAIKTWSELGFDPLRWDVWDRPEMRAENKFTDYYGTGVFDMLLTLKDELHAINLSEQFPQAQTLVQSQVVFKVMHERSLTPAEALRAAAEELRNQ